MMQNFKYPIRYSLVSKSTLKRLIIYMLIILISSCISCLLSSIVLFDKELIKANIIVFFLSGTVLFIFGWWIEFKYIWSKIRIVYPIHEQEAPPIIIGLILGIMYNVF